MKKTIQEKLKTLKNVKTCLMPNAVSAVYLE